MSFDLVLLAVVACIIGNNASSKTGAGIYPHAKGCNCDDLNVLTSQSWYYNWGNLSTFIEMKCPTNKLPKAEFVPMIWGWYGSISTDYVPSESTTILGFNEPNHLAQSSLSPSYAVEGWKVIQSNWPNKILVSPSASPCGANCISPYGQPLDWFDEFFRICNGTCNVDYLATHYYGCDANDAMEYVNSLRKYNLKIWLDEFNCPGGTKQQQMEFMQQLIPMLEASDIIYKYAWFMVRDSGTESLLTNNVSVAQLTDLGKQYNTY